MWYVGRFILPNVSVEMGSVVAAQSGLGFFFLLRKKPTGVPQVSGKLHVWEDWRPVLQEHVFMLLWLGRNGMSATPLSESWWITSTLPVHILVCVFSVFVFPKHVFSFHYLWEGSWGKMGLTITLNRLFLTRACFMSYKIVPVMGWILFHKVPFHLLYLNKTTKKTLIIFP